MLTTLMAFRRAARQIFQKYQFAIGLIFKFIISFAAYSRIVAELPYNETLDRFYIKFLFGIVGALVPQIITVALLLLTAVYEVFSVSPVMALLVAAVLLVLYCFAARFSGKFAYALIAIPLLMKYNMHYMIALLLGMTAAPTAIFPTAVGIVSYYVFAASKAAVLGSEIATMDDILNLYITFIDNIFANKEMIFVVLIFAFVIIVMWALRQLKFSYSFEITIFAGGALVAILHAVLAGFMTIKLSYVILGTMLSMIIVYIVQFFRMVLDYSAVETVSFEDDDYYYYVKAVPKLDRVVLGELNPTENTGDNKKENASDNEPAENKENQTEVPDTENPPETKFSVKKIINHMKALKKTHIQTIAEQSAKENAGRSVLDDKETENE